MIIEWRVARQFIIIYALAFSPKLKGIDDHRMTIYKIVRRVQFRGSLKETGTETDPSLRTTKVRRKRYGKTEKGHQKRVSKIVLTVCCPSTVNSSSSNSFPPQPARRFFLRGSCVWEQTFKTEPESQKVSTSRSWLSGLNTQLEHIPGSPDPP